MTRERPKLPRKARLCGGAQFTGAFSTRRRGRYFVVLVRDNPAGDAGRLGIIVSRRAAPRSVARSLMKRVVREVFRHLRRDLGAVDVVVRIRQPASRRELFGARQELQSLMSGKP